MSSLNELIQRGLSEVGYIEKASNKELDIKTANKGDGNYTKYSRDVNSYGLMGCQGQAWCCTFQFWLEVQEFGLQIALEHWNMTRTNYVGYNCFATYNKFKAKNKVGKVPKLGALVVFNFSHVGRVVKIYTENGVKYFDCLEGNTSSNLSDRNGGQVKIKKRPFNDSTVKGFCYIDYAEEEPHKTGWIKENNRWRYYHGDGTYIRNDWHLDETNHWSYFDDNGYALCNRWVFYKSNWYYFDNSCYMKTSTWIEYKNEWYYLTADGTMATKAYVLSKQPLTNKYYYVDADGAYKPQYDTSTLDYTQNRIVI